MKKLICTVGRRAGEEVEYSDKMARRLLADGRAITPEQRLKNAKAAKEAAKEVAKESAKKNGKNK